MIYHHRFVSDVMEKDFIGLLDALSEPRKFFGAEISLEAEAALGRLARRWKGLLTNGIWQIRVQHAHGM